MSMFRRFFSFCQVDTDYHNQFLERYNQTEIMSKNKANTGGGTIDCLVSQVYMEASSKVVL